MTQATVDIVTIQIQKSTSGLLAATSEELPGLFITHRDIKAIISNMPEVIRQIYRKRYGVDVFVVAAKSPANHQQDELTPRWVAMAPYLADKALHA